MEGTVCVDIGLVDVVKEHAGIRRDGMSMAQLEL